MKAVRVAIDPDLAVRSFSGRDGMMALTTPVMGVEGLSEAKVAEHPMTGDGIVEEVGGLDVAVNDALFMNSKQSLEQAAEVVLQVAKRDFAIVFLSNRGKISGGPVVEKLCCSL